MRAEEEEERRWEVEEMKAGWAAQEAEAVAKEAARRAHQQQLQEEVEVFNRWEQDGTASSMVWARGQGGPPGGRVGHRGKGGRGRGARGRLAHLNLHVAKASFSMLVESGSNSARLIPPGSSNAQVQPALHMASAEWFCELNSVETLSKSTISCSAAVHFSCGMHLACPCDQSWQEYAMTSPPAASSLLLAGEATLLRA